MMLTLIIILFILMSLVGGERGARSFFALVMNTVIGVVCLYAIALGAHPLAVMVISSFLFALLTLVFQNGWNDKTKASLLAVLMVVALTGALVYYVCFRGHISGFTEIELQDGNASYLSSGVSFRMRHLLLLAMIWGQLGAITDTSIAVSSALHEIAQHNPQFEAKRLFHEGMIIGRDILGTTINTLFFVSLGEGILLFLYYQTYQYSLQKILHSSSLAMEILPVLLPCIGCVLIIPITARIYSKRVEKKGK